MSIKSVNIISCDSLSKHYGEKKIIEEFSFGVAAQERIGLIGTNGCGKSTLLKIIAGIEYADTGNISLKRDTSIGYLPQEPLIAPDCTIFEHIYNSNHEHFRLLREYHSVCYDLEKNFSEELLQKQQHYAGIIESQNLWAVEHKALAILNKLSFDNYNLNTGILSGGQRRRLDIARVLTFNPDLLLLDEPTNHLDVKLIEWLQEYLTKYNGTMIFVTHDRYFLDSVSSKIAEIDKGKLFFYQGNYSSYLQAKDLQIQSLEKKEERRKSQLKKELRWLARGAKARATKPKDHLDRVLELIDKTYLVNEKNIEFKLPTHRLGKTILEIKNVSKKYDKTLIDNFSHFFQKNERIGIIGDNGSGKTTLLKIITDSVTPDTGSVKVGINTKFAYFEQEVDDFKRDMSVYDYISEKADNFRISGGTLASAKDVLEKFNFTQKDLQQRLTTLSGGEKKRLYLLKSLIQGANFILLDEPTNDLDIKTLERLEDYLDSFQGCLLVVSHDRYFLDRTVDFLLIFEDGIIKKFPGNYSDYLLLERYYTTKEPLNESKYEKKDERIKVPNKTSYKFVRETGILEEKMKILEQKRAEINSVLDEKRKLSVEEYKKIADELDAIDEEYLQCYERWETIQSDQI